MQKPTNQPKPLKKRGRNPRTSPPPCTPKLTSEFRLGTLLVHRAGGQCGQSKKCALSSTHKGTRALPAPPHPARSPRLSCGKPGPARDSCDSAQPWGLSEEARAPAGSQAASGPQTQATEAGGLWNPRLGVKLTCAPSLDLPRVVFLVSVFSGTFVLHFCQFSMQCLN